jgi:hypothetical protein
VNDLSADILGFDSNITLAKSICFQNSRIGIHDRICFITGRQSCTIIDFRFSRDLSLLHFSRTLITVEKCSFLIRTSPHTRKTPAISQVMIEPPLSTTALTVQDIRALMNRDEWIAIESRNAQLAFIEQFAKTECGVTFHTTVLA